MRWIIRLLFLAVLAGLGFYVGWPALSGYQLHAALERKDSQTVGRKIDFPSVRAALLPVVTKEVDAGMDRHLGTLGPLASLVGPALKREYAPRIVEATVNTLITPENVVRMYAEKDDYRTVAESILLEELGKQGGLFGFLTGAGKSGASSGTSLGDRVRLPAGLGGLSESVQGQLGGLSAGNAGSAAVPGIEIPDLKKVLKDMIEKERARRIDGANRESTAHKASPGKDGFSVSNIKHFGFNGPLAMEVGVAKSASAQKSDVLAQMAFSGADWRLTKLLPGL